MPHSLVHLITVDFPLALVAAFAVDLVWRFIKWLIRRRRR